MTHPLEQSFQEIRATLGKLDQALSNLNESIVWINEYGVIEWCNTVFCALSNRIRIEILGNNISDIIEVKQDDQRVNLFDLIKRAEESKTAELVRFSPTPEHPLVLEINSKKSQLAEHEICFVSVIRDVTEREELTQNLREKDARLSKLANFLDSIITSTSNMLIVSNPDFSIQFVNKTTLDTLGYSTQEIMNQPCKMLFDTSELKNEKNIFEFQKVIEGNFIHNQEVLFRKKNGDVFPVLFSVRTYVDQNKKIEGVVFTVQDITEFKEAEKKMTYLMYHDALTGLPNRLQCDHVLQREIVRMKRKQKFFSVLMLDVDNFKSINDTLGHDVGDQFLIVLSKKIRHAIREEDFFARFGGDEFIIIAADNKDELASAQIARNILRTLENPMACGTYLFHVSVSIGIATFPAAGTNKESLIKNADIAMYHAKSQGRRNFQFFSDNLNKIYLHRVLIETALNHALTEKEFYLVYQPQVSFNKKEITGIEVLLRWNNLKLGVVPPDEFIPIAEKLGLISSIGQWVLHTACMQFMAWRAENIIPSGCILAVNVSPYQLTLKLVSVLEDILKETQLPPHLLELEITESAIAHVEKSFNILNKLRSLGVRIAIDDFGAGYSSLGRIKDMQISTLKIDKSFVNNMVVDGRNAAIVRSIIQLARNLKVNVVPEGVETKEQMEFLKQNECEQGQGYYFSKPLTDQEMQKMLKSQSTFGHIGG